MSAYTVFVNKIKRIIKQALPGQTDIRVEKVSGDRPYLIVISDAFQGQTLKERQDMVRRPLEQELGAEITQISLIETYAPGEA